MKLSVCDKHIQIKKDTVNVDAPNCTTVAIKRP